MGKWLKAHEMKYDTNEIQTADSRKSVGNYLETVVQLKERGFLLLCRLNKQVTKSHRSHDQDPENSQLQFINSNRAKLFKI